MVMGTALVGFNGQFLPCAKCPNCGYSTIKPSAILAAFNEPECEPQPKRDLSLIRHRLS